MLWVKLFKKMVLSFKFRRLDINISFSILMEALLKKSLYYVVNYDHFYCCRLYNKIEKHLSILFWTNIYIYFNCQRLDVNTSFSFRIGALKLNISSLIYHIRGVYSYHYPPSPPTLPGGGGAAE